MRRLWLVLFGGLLVSLSLAAPAQAADSRPCAQYTYIEASSITLCGNFPGAQDRDCVDIGQPVRRVGTDPWRLDRDGDGKACEGLTGGPAPKAEPSATPSTKPTATPTTKPTVSKTPVAAAVTRPMLPKTGPGAPILVAIGATALLTGASALVLARMRRKRFVA